MGIAEDYAVWRDGAFPGRTTGRANREFLRAYQFHVSPLGGTRSELFWKCSDVEGLDWKFLTEQMNVNSFTKITTLSGSEITPITLVRAVELKLPQTPTGGEVTILDDSWREWRSLAQHFMRGEISDYATAQDVRRDIKIEMLSREGTPLLEVLAPQCIPIGYSLSKLSAKASELLLETLVLAPYDVPTIKASDTQ